MGKKKKIKNKDIPKEYRLSKKLPEVVREAYEKMGYPDPTQNYLELFSPAITVKLFEIMHTGSDNQDKADMVTDLLSGLGFEDRGCGTNITVMSNPLYPGVVFKIALDPYGIADNYNDINFQDMIPRYARVYARDASCIVSVQERYYVMDQYDMARYLPIVKDYLKILKDSYLLADISPKSFLNYGIDRKGKFVIIDGSDLYPLKQLKGGFTCKRIVKYTKKGDPVYCGGKLEYINDYYQCRCKKCNDVMLPIMLRPRKEGDKVRNIFRDSTTEEIRAQRNAYEHQCIEARKAAARNVKDDEPVNEQVEVHTAPKFKFRKMEEQNVVEPEQQEAEVAMLDEVEDDVTPGKVSADDEVFMKMITGSQRKSKEIPHGEPIVMKVSELPEDFDDEEVDEVPEEVRQAITNIIRTADVITEEPEDSDDEADEPEVESEDGYEDDVNSAPTVVRFTNNKTVNSNSVMATNMSGNKTASKGSTNPFLRLKKITEEQPKVQEEPSDQPGRAMTTDFEARLAMLRKNSPSAFKNYIMEFIQVVGEDYVEECLNELRGTHDSTVGDSIAEADHLPHVDDTELDLMDPNESSIVYNVVTINDSASEDLPGIYLRINGDFEEAFMKCGLPIYVTSDKTGHETAMLVIGSEPQFKELVLDAYNELLDDYDLLDREEVDDEEDDYEADEDEMEVIFDDDEEEEDDVDDKIWYGPGASEDDVD